MAQCNDKMPLYCSFAIFEPRICIINDFTVNLGYIIDFLFNISSFVVSKGIFILL